MAYGADKTHGKEVSGRWTTTTIIVLALLSARFVVHAIMRRYSKGILKETYLNSSLLVVTEVIKIIISSYNLEFTDERKTFLEELKHVMSNSIAMMVPAGVYLVMNWLSLYAFTSVDASMFAMVQQLKILSTAIFAVLYLSKAMPVWKWLVLTLLTISVCAIAYRRSDLEGKKGGGDQMVHRYMVGIACILVEVALSGWVSNYFEKHLKDKTANLSVWARNLQMSSYSLLLFIPVMYSEVVATEGATFYLFQGWSIVTWGLAVLGAVTGFLVAFATKLTDSVTKTLATTMGLLLTYATEVLLLGLSFDVVITANSAIAVLAVTLYNQKLVAEDDAAQPVPL